uniref:Uncharacterized protein n=1 Tax=Tanacetum cinerariifolium TaxID=118510 RepID=A0A6L2N224_TANCI|nr:hypothetical protein [Tanacetum cinerariifolium]
MEEMCDTLSDKVAPMTVSISSDMLKEALPRIMVESLPRERERVINNCFLNVHPTTHAFTATTISDLQQQLYLKMKSDLQAQVANPELWDVRKDKFEKYLASAGSCRDDAFCKRDHDEHQGDDAPPEGEKSAKRQKASKSSKSARRFSSKQLVKENNTSASECQRQQQDWDAWVDDPVVDEDERNLNEPPRYLYNKDIFFLKYGNTEEKRVHEEDSTTWKLRPQDNESIRKRDYKASKTLRADEKMGVICEWKINYVNDEALRITNPYGDIVRIEKVFIIP